MQGLIQSLLPVGHILPRREPMRRPVLKTSATDLGSATIILHDHRTLGYPSAWRLRLSCVHCSFQYSARMMFVPVVLLTGIVLLAKCLTCIQRRRQANRLPRYGQAVGGWDWSSRFVQTLAADGRRDRENAIVGAARRSLRSSLAGVVGGILQPPRAYVSGSPPEHSSRDLEWGYRPIGGNAW